MRKPNCFGQLFFSFFLTCFSFVFKLPLPPRMPAGRLDRDARQASGKLASPTNPRQSIGGIHICSPLLGRLMVAFMTFLKETSVASKAMLNLCCFAATLLHAEM